MIVKHIENVMNTKDDIDTATWNSRRMLLHKDGMGFSMHDTIIKSGTETLIWYRNHLEAVYCIEGSGEIEVIDGDTYKITPGTLYALNGHEKHLLRATSEMRMICVFNPPLTGMEVHDDEGVYPTAENYKSKELSGNND